MAAIIHNPSEMQLIANELRIRGNKIGFVPTMGSLHEGHFSLIRRSVQENDVTIVSIFINPTQFDDSSDFNKYPRDPERDVEGCEREGVDFIFIPSAEDMYPDSGGPAVTWVEIAGSSTETLCGLSRPGHFRGVVTICSKLFNIIHPHFAYFGQKDYQQYYLINRLVESMHIGVEISLSPIIRETSGLALSSRNSRLTPKDKKTALVLYNSLNAAHQKIMKGETSTNVILEDIAKAIVDSGMDMDYVIIADPTTLEDVTSFDKPVLIAVAATLNEVRLIDNILIDSIPRVV